MTVTPFYAGILTLLFLGLSARVIVYRRGNGIGLGDAGDKSLLKRMRAQANCAEYAPMGIVLLGLAELQGSPTALLHVLGSCLLLGRIAHGYGFSASPPVMALRVGGMALTILMLTATAILLIGQSLFG